MTGEPLTDEEIRERAYQIYLARGGAPGGALDDWLQAEREQQHEQSSSAAKTPSAPSPSR